MAEETEPEVAEDEAPPKKKGRGGLILALVFLLVGGGGGFFATFSGMVPTPFGDDAEHAEEAETPKPATEPGFAFVPLEEIVVPLSPRARARHLLFQASLEVDPQDVETFETLKPRILDMMNTYLRAVEERDFDTPDAALILRQRLLRRVQAAVAPASARDLLITSFVLK